MALAKLEGGVIDHASLHAMSGEHSIETTKRLQRLVKLGFLHSSGGRGATYTLDGVEHVRVEDVFGVEVSENQDITLAHKESSLSPKESSLSPKEPSLSPKELSLSPKSNSTQRDPEGRLCHELLPFPIVDNENYLSEEYKTIVYEVAKEARERNRLSAQRMEAIILELCRAQYFTLSTLAVVLNRNSRVLRRNYLLSLVKTKKLLLAFPATPTHEKQAYRTNTDFNSEDTDNTEAAKE